MFFSTEMLIFRESKLCLLNISIFKIGIYGIMLIFKERLQSVAWMSPNIEETMAVPSRNKLILEGSFFSPSILFINWHWNQIDSSFPEALKAFKFVFIATGCPFYSTANSNLVLWRQTWLFQYNICCEKENFVLINEKHINLNMCFPPCEPKYR